MWLIHLLFFNKYMAKNTTCPTPKNMSFYPCICILIRNIQLKVLFCYLLD